MQSPDEESLPSEWVMKIIETTLEETKGQQRKIHTVAMESDKMSSMAQIYSNFKFLRIQNLPHYSTIQMSKAATAINQPDIKIVISVDGPPEKSVEFFTALMISLLRNEGLLHPDHSVKSISFIRQKYFFKIEVVLNNYSVADVPKVLSNVETIIPTIISGITFQIGLVPSAPLANKEEKTINMKNTADSILTRLNKLHNPEGQNPTQVQSPNSRSGTHRKPKHPTRGK